MNIVKRPNETSDYFSTTNRLEIDLRNESNGIELVESDITVAYCRCSDKCTCQGRLSLSPPLGSFSRLCGC